MNLSALAGNAPLKQQLEQQTARRGLSHAYILCGPAGSGKHVLSGLLSAALVCSAGTENAPCGRCSGCKKAFGGIHPDIIPVWDGERDINVSQVRALRADAYIRPNEAARKVYVLEQAQNMNESAQNALLKLLEEGPAYAAFLFLTDNIAALLPTVRSRCETLNLSPVSLEEAQDYLLARYPDRERRDVLEAARRCEGLLGRAVDELEHAGSGEELERRTALALMDALARGDELALAEGCIALENDKKTWDRDRLSALMEECVLLCRDALLAGAGAEEEADPQRREEARQLSRVLSPRALMEAIALFHRLRTACGFYVGGGHLAGWLCAGLAALRSK